MKNLSVKIADVVLGMERSQIEDSFSKKVHSSIHKAAEDWVKSNNVENVEMFVTSDMLEDYGEDVSELEELTDGIKIQDMYYDDMADITRDAFSKGSKGPGYNYNERIEIRYNDEYFYAGSDGTYYILVHKI